MDSYKIEWKKSAVKELRKLGKKNIPKIITTVEGLAKDPLSGGVRRLIGSENTFRVRVGNYRIIYEKLEQRLIVKIIRVGHRKNVYKK